MSASKLSEITIERQPSQDRLEQLGVSHWPIWSKEISEFPWTYDETETCYFLEGEVIITPSGGESVKMGKGDLVTFPAGLSCTWKILQNASKHYSISH